MPTASEPNLISKITIKSIGANPKEAVKQEKRVVLAAIYGSAVETKAVMGLNGDAQDALLGTFEAVNPATGNIYRAGKLFLPKTAQQLVAAEVKKLGDGSSSVDFAFEIAAVPSDKSAVGYEYEVRSLIKPAVADPLEQMRNQIASSHKQFALAAGDAPKKEAAKK